MKAMHSPVLPFSAVAAAPGHAQQSRELARLKTALLASGLRVARDVQRRVARYARPPMRVRSGACGGLDVILPDGTYVNCPTREHFAGQSQFALVTDGEALRIEDRAGGPWPGSVPVQLPPRPEFYDRHASDGTPLARIGQVCSDRLGIGLTNVCAYWRSSARRCKFCSIGLNVATEEARKPIEHIVEVVDAAYSDPTASARHLLLGGGTPEGPDAGAELIAAAAAAVKARWDRPIYAMLAPPDDLAYIDLLAESGVDEVAINIELFDPGAAAHYTPGKWRKFGHAGYLRALERAVEVFGPVHSRSIMVVGLEPPEATLRGVEALVSRGVMPILSPFRPMVRTELEHHPRMSADALWAVCEEAHEIAASYDMPLGPTCVACQSNSLTVPGDRRYRFY
jgi:hypothetical protein